MTSTNLALVFGSALLKKGKFGKRESRRTKLGIDHYVASVNVIRAMIDNWDVLFQVGEALDTFILHIYHLLTRQGSVVCWQSKQAVTKSPHLEILLILGVHHAWALHREENKWKDAMQ